METRMSLRKSLGSAWVKRSSRTWISAAAVSCFTPGLRRMNAFQRSWGSAGGTAGGERSGNPPGKEGGRKPEKGESMLLGVVGLPGILRVAPAEVVQTR